MVKLGTDKSRRIPLITLFGTIVFVSKTLLPSPYDKTLVVIQAMLLALGSLLSRPLGATMVAAIGAALTILLRPTLAPITMAFALIYGLLTDVSTFVFHVKSPEGEVRTKRLVTAVTVSTAITGISQLLCYGSCLEPYPEKSYFRSCHSCNRCDKRARGRLPRCADMEEGSSTFFVAVSS